MPTHEQGWQRLRPSAFGDVRDQMSAKQRRSAFWSDLMVAGLGTLVICLAGSL